MLDLLDLPGPCLRLLFDLVVDDLLASQSLVLLSRVQFVHLIKVVSEGVLVRFEFDDLTLADQHVQNVPLHAVALEWAHVPLQELKARLDFLLVEHLGGLVVREQHDQLLFEQLALVLLVEQLVLVFNLILDDLFNDVFQRHDANDLLSGVFHAVAQDGLGDNSDVGEAFLEVAEQRLELVLVLDGDYVADDYARHLLECHQRFFGVD